MPIGSSLGVTLPTQGGNTGTWGTDLNDELQKLIDAIEANVPVSALDWTTNVSVNSNALTDIDHVAFDELSAPPSNVRAFYFDSAGEAYIKDGAGNAIQVTSAGTLNAATAGGVVGMDYGSGSIEVRWDTGTSYYWMKAGAGDAYAGVAMSDLTLVDTGTGYDITISPPTLGADYALTLPTALPGSAAAVQVSAAGVVSFSSSFSTDLTLSGSAVLKHGNRVRQYGVSNMHPWEETSGSNQIPGFRRTSGDLTANSSAASSSHKLDLDLGLDVGERLVSLTHTGIPGSGTFTVTLYAYNVTTGSYGTAIASGTSAASGASPGTVTLSSVNRVVAANESLYLLIDYSSAGAATAKALGGVITYDRP